jgi:hypothetical protein
MTKLIGPRDITSLSVAGIAYSVVNGVVDVEPAHVADLVNSFGFALPDENEPDIDPFEAMTRTQMFDFLKTAGVAVQVNSKNDVLRDICRQVAADKVAADAKAEADARAKADADAADAAAAEAKRVADEEAAKVAADAAEAAKTAAAATVAPATVPAPETPASAADATPAPATPAAQ